MKKILLLISILFLSFMVVGCSTNRDPNDQKVEKINQLISQLPEIITILDEDKIKEIDYIYNSLPDIYKNKVNDYYRVEKAKETIEKIKQSNLQSVANDIILQIDNLPSLDDISLDDFDSVKKVNNSYQNLEINVKKLVTNYSKLQSLINKLQTLQDEFDYLEQIKKQALEVIESIEKLPDTSLISLAEKEKVIYVKTLYDQLNNDAKKLVTNYEKLDLLLKRLVTIENAIKEANKFDELVNALPDMEHLSTIDKTNIDQLNALYQKLTELEKSYVTTYDKLKLAKEQINKLEKAEMESILDSISDIATSNTIEDLILENDYAKFKWTSSNNNLYVINNDKAYVNKAYQTHQSQTVQVTVQINYFDGTSKEVYKDILVEPVLFEDLPTTPVATYFHSSALSNYQKYSNRYQSEKTLFSSKAKNVLDIVYYAFATPKSDGTIKIENISAFNQIIKLRENGIRVVLSINGVSSDTYDAFNTITKNDTLLATFVKNVMDLVDEKYLDGIDLDWESVSGSKTVVASQMNKLVKALREEMNQRQAKNGSNYLLTAAIPGTSWGAGDDRFDFKTLNNYLDFVNMMSYDSNRSDKTTHHAPLYQSLNDQGYKFGVDYATKLFKNKGLSTNKIIIGAAGYGKAYKITGTVSSTTKYPGLGVSGTLTKIDGINGSFSSGTLYGNAVNTLMQNSNYIKYIEYNNNNLVGSYLYNSIDKIFVTYEGSESIKAKYEYAKKLGLGIMCWAYTEDTSDTYVNTIYEIIK